MHTALPGEQVEPSVATSADGRFVVAYRTPGSGFDTSGTSLVGQVFAPDGERLGFGFPINSTTAGDQNQPAITALADGRFAVVWTDDSATGGDLSESAVRGQIFDPDGARPGGEFLVNTTT